MHLPLPLPSAAHDDPLLLLLHLHARHTQPHTYATQVTVPAGVAAVVQGEPAADRFYIVEDGELKAEIEGAWRAIACM